MAAYARFQEAAEPRSAPFSRFQPDQYIAEDVIIRVGDLAVLLPYLEIHVDADSDGEDVGPTGVFTVRDAEGVLHHIPNIAFMAVRAYQRGIYRNGDMVDGVNKWVEDNWPRIRDWAFERVRG